MRARTTILCVTRGIKDGCRVQNCPIRAQQERSYGLCSIGSIHFPVIPAKAGIKGSGTSLASGSRFRGNDEEQWDPPYRDLLYRR